MSSRSGHDLLYHFLAPALLILTPFVSFITYNRYSYAAPEIWICLAGLAAVALLLGLTGTVGGWPARVVLTAGLLVLFMDIQFGWFDSSSSWRELRVIGVFLLALLLSWAMRRHLSRIVTAAFATMLVSTIVLGSVQDVGSPSPPAAAINDPKPRSHRAPVFVHLILDEYIGLEGIPVDVPHGREMRTYLHDFFERYGFRLFGRAYSRYGNTYNAIPNIMNFSSESVDGALISGSEPYVMIKNKYFEQMYDSGYNIYVYGSGYIDFCGMSVEHPAKCQDSAITGINLIQRLDITLAERVLLIYQIYASLSDLHTAIGGYYRSLRERTRSSGWTLPEWWFKEARLGPVPSMPLFDRVTADVARSSPGDMFFVYLLMPHFPYVYDGMCNLYPPAKWEQPVNPAPIKLNDRQSRAIRYGRYLEQVRCLHRKLGAMFQAWQEAGIFDRLVIVMHGDHGSKISEHRAHAKNEQELSRADYVDTFSTLFAVKEPGVAAGYDRRIAAIQDLLGEVVGRQAGDGPTQTKQIPYVFLKGDPGKPMLRRPLPVFGDRG
jgi:hypothetical protein